MAATQEKYNDYIWQSLGGGSWDLFFKGNATKNWLGRIKWGPCRDIPTNSLTSGRSIEVKHVLCDIALMFVIFTAAQTELMSWQNIVLMIALVAHAILHRYVGRAEVAERAARAVQEYHVAAKKYVASLQQSKE